MAGVKLEIKISLARPQEAPIPLLSIPRSDVERLACLPFRWLRYVVFAICGAHGDIHGNATGVVDYDRTEVPSDENEYRYVPSASEQYAFIDPEGWNDKITSSALTDRRRTFREDIIQRDGPACIVTAAAGGECDAAHLIPKSKGDVYLERVMELRSRGENIEGGINDIRNGVLVNTLLHRKLARAEVAFIRTTPDGLLRPEDIKRFSRGDPREEYITLQQLKKPQIYDHPYSLFLRTTVTLHETPPTIAFDFGANVDALFQGEGTPLPHPVILDYFYGLAAYKCWRIGGENGSVPEVLSNYREAHYTRFPSPVFEPEDSEHNTSDSGASRRHRSTRDYRSTRRGESEILKVMDELNELLMYASGTTPEAVAERNRKQMEQRERAAQEAGRSKVMEWRQRSVY
ncbi:hypothetical protein DXG03_001515 [Asterophora parasitica]|uniref:HNH nuclease domain-containing protein n=1 Tax=Asterophora parasitica TaxID=117018 RepID=A0A9P7FWU2_9AGAR|nr:hypothetical protein DXG03_001515 [Asterophora parasitica]